MSTHRPGVRIIPIHGKTPTIHDSAFVAPGTSQFSRSMLLSVASAAQLVFPRERAGTWRTEENDTTGRKIVLSVVSGETHLT